MVQRAALIRQARLDRRVFRENLFHKDRRVLKVKRDRRVQSGRQEIRAKRVRRDSNKSETNRKIKGDG